MKTYTERGFANYGATVDDRGTSVTVRQSSAMGEPCCWLFVKDRDGKEWTHDRASPGGVAVVSPHLSRQQAHDLAMRLLAFAHDSDYDESNENVSWRQYTEVSWDTEIDRCRVIVSSDPNGKWEWQAFDMKHGFSRMSKETFDDPEECRHASIEVARKLLSGEERWD